MKYKEFFYISLGLAVAASVFCFMQNVILENFFINYHFIYPVWKIYVFHFATAFVVFSALFIVSKINANYIGFTFMGFILLKMAAAVIFLLPLIKLENASKIPDFISFFFPYFTVLFLEIVFTLRLLKASDK